MKYKGVIDTRCSQYTEVERLHLIRCLSFWKANLYIYGQLEWASSIVALGQNETREFARIARQCLELEIELWAWIKPGDFRYVYHASDRKILIENAKRYLNLGAKGFYLLMDDLHPKDPSNPMGHIRKQDAKYHALLIQELALELGPSFKAICGEHYHGDIPGEFQEYWDPILSVLPKEVMITWTGPGIWSKNISPEDVPALDWPILLFDNFFASDSDDPERSPMYPYTGRDTRLIEYIEAVVINPNNHYAWQYCALQTAMAFWNKPMAYMPDKAFAQAIRDLGDLAVEDYVKAATINQNPGGMCSDHRGGPCKSK